MRAVSILISFGLAFLTGCHSPEARNEDAAQAKFAEGKLVLPQGSPQLASLSVESIEPEASSVLRLTGRLVWDDDVTVRIFTPFAGRVTRVIAQPGQPVKQGDPLALIASPDYGQAQADARKAATDFLLADRTLSRIRELFEHGAAPHKDLQSAEADLARAVSERQRTEGRLAFYGNDTNSIIDQIYVLKSPLDGVVVEKNINPGQEVRSDQMLASAPQLFSPLFVVTDPRRLWLLVDLNEHQISHIKAGQEVAIHALAYPSQEFPGKIEVISDFLDSTTRTIKLRASVDNTARLLKAEMLVRVDLPMPKGAGFNVASSAVFLRGDKHYLFVEEELGTFSRREVKIGGEQSGKISVLEGIQSGQRVVTGNSLMLDQLFTAGGG
jgi:cobalt-zinc-cadmium efflux system membrane fusion protein